MKVLSLVALALAGVAVESRPPAAEQATTERNKAVVRYVFEGAWNAERFDSLVVVWAPDVQFHVHGRTSTVAPSAVRSQVANWRRAFGDFRFTIHELVAEGDRVAARLTFAGTHRARFMGIDSTGRSVSVTQMMFFRLVDGRVV